MMTLVSARLIGRRNIDFTPRGAVIVSEAVEKNVETTRFVMGAEQGNCRFDKALSMVSADLTRSRAQGLIKEGCVKLNGLVCSDTSRKVRAGEVVELEIPEASDPVPQPENIPLDVVYEDRHLLVINKQAGLVVHPGACNWTGTLVNALLHHCGDSLSGIGGVARPGIVHRLDKDTSGLMVVAKNDAAHRGLSEQLEDRSLSRVYKALVLKVPTPLKGTIDRPIGRDPRNRLRMAIKGQNGKEARTHYLVKGNYNEACALVECKLESGRTHQIRVHMASMKHTLIGDPLYGPQRTALIACLQNGGYDEDVIAEFIAFPRQALHAERISFIHPITDELMSFESSLPEDFSKLLKMLES
jgi:23S rRNA pseudouridine1911/1915/1917 synthase